MMSIWFVVATKDRPADLRNLMDSLADQTHRPDGVVVVDSSAPPVKSLVATFHDRLRTVYTYHQPPSAAGQRNAGLELLPEKVNLVAFVDDDAVFEADALKRMIDFWQQAPADVGGATFNMTNHPPMVLANLKHSRLAKVIGLSSAEPGVVLPSGWQNPIGTVHDTTYVDWLPTTAVVWRAAILRSCRFDEFFTGYSYMEDLDFSFGLRRHWRLVVVADARYAHYPSPARHYGPFGFGRMEVRNRLYFVGKHRLSYSRCWVGLMTRLALTAVRGEALRALGNGVEIALQLGARTVVSAARTFRASCRI